MPDGPGRFRQDFTSPALLRILMELIFLTCTGLSPSMVQLSRNFYFEILIRITVLQPHVCRNNHGLGSSLFARHYLGNHYCFLFLWVIRCFSSPGLPPFRDSRSSIEKVAPFGNLRITSYFHFPVAYRRLSRPSSPLRAKAFAIRSYLLYAFFINLIN